MSEEGPIKRRIKLNSDSDAITEETFQGEVYTEELSACRTCHKIVKKEEAAQCKRCERHAHLECLVAGLCEPCLIEKYRLNSRKFKILVCLDNDVSSLSEIIEITKVPEAKLIQAINDLAEAGHIIKRKGWFSTKLEITDDGIQAYAMCERVFTKRPDVQLFLNSLRHYLVENGPTMKPLPSQIEMEDEENEEN